MSARLLADQKALRLFGVLPLAFGENGRDARILLKTGINIQAVFVFGFGLRGSAGLSFYWVNDKVVSNRKQDSDCRMIHLRDGGIAEMDMIEDEMGDIIFGYHDKLAGIEPHENERL